ncbi:type II toxin-antitoxin system RelE/ParE family toxin [Hymenobacter fodinae]|uniref:Type II toxin-antitoxin system RelE/ParE family toxin n=1 Tax=Hymenobacter fodinae TaxID=2510796 RepID=A0A4Z0P3G3_9BACT|nr:type II toxin-antitoxin system RelE/ParE family toxin [Hymenobacter fodinae]TGE05550.1 type II toxin-antitoxin system RelE/ParE family toxin [Hymenobacter fodinae]
MIKPIEVSLSDEADEFIEDLPATVRKRFTAAFDKTQLGIKGDWFKKLPDTDDIWEFRVNGANHTYRVFAFWDTRGDTETLIICTHGLDKKSQKTPVMDISKAERFKYDYFQNGPS